MKDKEDQLLLAKVMDKRKQMQVRNRIEMSDFLNSMEKEMVEKSLQTQRITQYAWVGGYKEAEREVVLFYPEKLEERIEEGKLILQEQLMAIRIQLPKEKIGEYTHRNYLGAIVKLGIKREKVGDILVNQEGADIIVKPDMAEYLIQNLPSLTRFQKAKIEIIKAKDLRIPEDTKQVKKIIIPSLRLDAVISELIGSSRTKAAEIIMEERVFINYKTETKLSKEIKIGDKITVRGKGKFEIKAELGSSKKNKKIIEVIQY